MGEIQLLSQYALAMAIAEGARARLVLKNAPIEEHNDELRSELVKALDAPNYQAEAGLSTRPTPTPDSVPSSNPDWFDDAGVDAETTVTRTGRPALVIARDTVQPTFTDPDGEVWRTRFRRGF
ncbi:hypothetical protein [Nocardia salmonicida]|uniref:hypothetical protein n=1 Tax=Nocardia salmonicida TaxID=53431 RepID=UPI0007A428BA|nr:hypothetical protein [Nocardia salmonicida]